MIFPEGRRSATGAIDTFRPGIGMIASRLRARVVPVRIDGPAERPARRLAHGQARTRPRRVRRAHGRWLAMTTRRSRSRSRTPYGRYDAALVA